MLRKKSNECISSPVQGFTNHETGSQIDLIGAVHVGTPDYYQEMQDLIDCRVAVGAVVHYEGLKTLSKEEFDSRSPDMQKSIAALRLVKDLSLRQYLEIGLVSQRETLTYPKEWQNHDITEGEQACLLGRRSLGLMTKLISAEYTTLASLSPEKRQARAMKSLEKSVGGKISLLARLAKFSSATTVRRNEVALEAVDDTLEKNPATDLVLLWGAAHLPGLRKGLEERNYQLSFDDSLIVARMPNAS